MRMSNRVIGLIKTNYKTVTPFEFNNMFKRLGLRTFREVTIQKKIDMLLQQDAIKESKRLVFEKKALENPIEYRAKTLLSSAKYRANKKGLDYNLNLEWLVKKLNKGKCEMTNLNFNIKKYSKKKEKEKINSLAPSLDRLDPNKGYTTDNVKVVCDQFNKMKSDKSLKETYKLAKAFVKNFKRTKNKKLYDII